MREIRTSGLMSGDGKRGGAVAPVLAPILDSTGVLRRTSARTPTWQPGGTLWVTLWVVLWVWSLHALDANRQNV